MGGDVGEDLCEARARAILTPTLQLLHDSVCFAIRFLNPLHNSLRRGRVFQLNADNAVVSRVSNGRKVSFDGSCAASRWKIAVYLAVTIGKMHVTDLAFQLRDFLDGRSHKMQMGNVAVCSNSLRHIHVSEKP